uniref:Putative secreted protein n=1 Tax=Ixodes ricinus TaxID=34613 RepID=A0A6B0TXJ6_IXORI
MHLEAFHIFVMFLGPPSAAIDEIIALVRRTLDCLPCILHRSKVFPVQVRIVVRWSLPTLKLYVGVRRRNA